MAREKKIRLSEMTYDDFMDALHYGYKAGWISDIKCATHDGIPSTDSEDADWEEGYDPCQTVLRFWGKSGKQEQRLGDIVSVQVSD